MHIAANMSSWFLLRDLILKRGNVDDEFAAIVRCVFYFLSSVHSFWKVSVGRPFASHLIGSQM